jgi:hypothetical protein
MNVANTIIQMGLILSCLGLTFWLGYEFGRNNDEE